MDKLDFLLVKFTEHMKIIGFSERTIPDYVHYLKELKIEQITEVDRRVLQDYQARIYLQTFKGKPLSPSTQRARIYSVKTFYGYLIKAGLALYDPASDLEMPKRPNQLPKGILSKKEIGTLLSKPPMETALGIRDRAILEVFYSTGIRVSELCNLTINDLDLSAGELRVNQGKGKKDRVVPLGEMACDFLEIYLGEARPKLTASGQQVLFISKTGRKFHPTTMSHLIANYGKKASLKNGTSPHALKGIPAPPIF